VKIAIVIGISLGLFGCGSSSAPEGSGEGGGASSAGAASGGASSAGAASGGASSAGAASGGASGAAADNGGSENGGTPNGSAGASGTDPAPFTPVAELWIGAPDDPATTVVYLFSKPTVCSAIGKPGWDAKLAPGTQQLELKEFGNGPAMYQVVTTKTPAPGEASVNYNTNVTGTATETVITGGTVTLTKVTAKKNATGTYALTFGATRLDGLFDATYCAGGVEP